VPRIVALTALLLLCSRALPDDVAASRLGVLLGGMRSIEAAFSQRLSDESGEPMQESSGRVLLAHPGRFRWETTAPFEQLVVSDGTTVWQYDADLQQVVVRPLDRRADQVPSLLLSGEIEAVGKLFDIRAAAAPAGRERFELVPREPGGLFAALEVEFAGGVLARLAIADGFGQRTEVEFSGVTPVAGFGEELFRFEAPPGVDELLDE
jgi:outer membrane lipoprotein carrier protein